MNTRTLLLPLALIDHDDDWREAAMRRVAILTDAIETAERFLANGNPDGAAIVLQSGRQAAGD